MGLKEEQFRTVVRKESPGFVSVFGSSIPFLISPCRLPFPVISPPLRNPMPSPVHSFPVERGERNVRRFP